MKNGGKLSREDMIAQLQKRGWDFITGTESFPVRNGTLEEAARAAHSHHKQGKRGVIKNIEAEVELDLIQLEQLWEHLGLPM